MERERSAGAGRRSRACGRADPAWPRLRPCQPTPLLSHSRSAASRSLSNPPSWGSSRSALWNGDQRWGTRGWPWSSAKHGRS
eukprot:8110898-Alexandrium_andersonii.AAC.1